MNEALSFAFRNVIVIGASAGGIPALKKLFSGLPENLDAAILVVIHVSAGSNTGIIAGIIQKKTALKCVVPHDRTPVRRGMIYFAPPNHHMMVKDDIITINRGARENRYRPSIDVLFRSAAVYYGSRVVGIVLTGMLEDGTAGMMAIKRCGGILIVQDPSEAEFPDMPQSVINQMDVDYKADLNKIGPLLKEITEKPLPPRVPVPYELRSEADITENMMTSISDLEKIADRTDLTCPDCGGGLWAIRNDPVHRYRCHTGHVFNDQTLYEARGINLEQSVWVSIRILEERRNMLRLMAMDSEKSGDNYLANDRRNRAKEIEKHIEGLKILLAKMAGDQFGENESTGQKVV